MSWVRIEDRAPEHRKQLAAGPAACWLWLCGLAYANRQPQHDGFIPSAALPLLGCGARAAKEAARLVDVGLWERVEGGWWIHDYHEYQLTPDQLSARAAAGRRGGVRSGEMRRSKREANGEAFGEANGKQTLKQTRSDHRTSPDPDPGSDKNKTAASETRSPRADAREPPNRRRSDPTTQAASESFDSTPGESESGTRLVAPVVKAHRALAPPEPLSADLEARRQAQLRELESRREEFEPAAGAKS